jgi:hypothetical protein
MASSKSPNDTSKLVINISESFNYIEKVIFSSTVENLETKEPLFLKIN